MTPLNGRRGEREGREGPVDAEGEGRRRVPGWLGLLARSTIALILIGFATHLLARPFHVPSGSMEPTLQVGDRVIGQVVGVDRHGLDRGKIVIFGHGEQWSDSRLPEDDVLWKELVRDGGDLLGVGPSHTSHTVKRVIGTPGERVSCCDEEGRVLVDGAALTEPYVPPERDHPFVPGSRDCDSEPVSTRCFPELTVPEDSYLVLGDNRAGSSDSVAGCRGGGVRASDCARFVRSDQVVGVLGWRFWPLPPGSVD